MTDRDRLAEIKARAQKPCFFKEYEVLWLITQLEATQNALDKALGQQAGKDGT